MNLLDMADIARKQDKEEISDKYDKFQKHWKLADNDGTWLTELHKAYKEMGHEEFYEFCDSCAIDPDMLDAAGVGDVNDYMTWIYINIK